ncbi:MAG: M20/M25/M40 family metallo-hydrolase, partial [Isoptericola variabilis]|nr:M20/M25/M40 family metallo-hydrolase [Isoptericola variabilis]
MVYPGRMADTSHTLSSSVLRERLEAAFPSLLEELTQLVAIPSVSSDPAHAADVERSAEHIRERFAALGLDAKVLRETAEDGTEGKPALVAHSPRIEGAPTVLLYAHHDVQPVGELSRWSLDPYKAEVRGDRIYGRGSSDDGAGITVHLGSLSILREDLPVNVVVFIEGEEEIGSPSFTAF